jgi:hypothetical protein
MFADQLAASKLRESETRVATKVLALYKVSTLSSDLTFKGDATLLQVSCLQKVDIFAREMMDELEMMAVQRLSGFLEPKTKHKEAHFVSRTTHWNAFVSSFQRATLMEAESAALRMLIRYQEKLSFAQYCM